MPIVDEGTEVLVPSGLSRIPLPNPPLVLSLTNSDNFAIFFNHNLMRVKLRMYYVELGDPSS